MTESTSAVLEDKGLIESWVPRWGCSASEAILDFNCEIFRDPSIEGFIGYRIESSCAVAYGDPVCPKEDQHRLAESFRRFCQEKKLNTIFIIASKDFAKWAIHHNLSKVLVEVGEELIFDPQHNPIEGSKGQKLRNKVNHATHEGLKVQEYIGHDHLIEKSIQEAGNQWIQGRKGPQIYLSKLNFFQNRQDRRWFYVTNRKNQVIGAAIMTKLEAHKGWLLKFLIVVPRAPSGTSELLMTYILETLRHEGCRYLTYGMVPARNIGEMVGINALSQVVAGAAFKITKWIFGLNNRKTYWQKFHPHTEPSYILVSEPKLGLSEVKAILKTLRIRMK